MTLFRKYYKEANNEIVSDEVLISRVIANAHKPPKKRNQYINYAAALAAAVFVVSAAVISMPVWQRVEEDNGVIIEEYVDKSPSPTASQSEISEENAFPVQDPHSFATVKPPENDYDNSNDVKNTIPSVKEKSKSDYSGSNNEFTVNTAAPQIKTEDEDVVLDTPLLPEVSTEKLTKSVYKNSEENEVGSDMSVSDTGDTKGETTDIADSSSVNSSGNSGGGGGSGAFHYSYTASVSVNIPTPPGFYSAGLGSGYASFASDGGATITVNYSACNYSSSPSYSTNGDIITASFATGSVAYSIYAVGADMGDVEYIVNSLYDE